MSQRPPNFNINPDNNFAQGLVFAGLGKDPGNVTMFDSSRYLNNGTLTNMDPSTDWVFVPELGRRGLDFDGSNDKVMTPARIDQPVFSMALWIKPTYTDYDHRSYVATSNVDGTNGRVLLLGYQAGYFNLFSATSTYPTGNAADSQFAATTSWQHVVAQTDGTKVYVYHNGVGTIDVTGAWTTTAGYTRRLSGYNESIRFFAGQLSDYIQWDRLLSPAEIADLADPSNVYLSGLITYSIPKSFVSFYNTPISTTFRRVGSTFNRSPIAKHSFVGGIK